MTSFARSAVFLGLLAIAAPALASDDEHHRKNHLGISIGPAFHKGKTAGFVGLDYVRSLSHLVAVGVYTETVSGEFDLDALGFVVGLTPGGGWKVSTGFGVERKLGADKSKWLISLNAGYDFRLTRNWSIGPMVSIDFIEDNTEVIYVATAFGFGF